MKAYKIIISLLVLLLSSFIASAQIALSTTTHINTVCNGNPCTYNGPKILINEVMLAPTVGDGSIYGQVNGVACEGEWIELYNPDICQSIDISCFFLGNNVPNIISYPASGGFVIPNGTVVPPRGFVVIRGVKASAVPPNLLIQNGGSTIEIIVNSSLSGNVCIEGGQRLWFPNAGGWFAFYDDNGVPQDAISWYNSYSCMNCPPCNPLVSTCGYTGSLAPYDNIPAAKKNYITPLFPSDHLGQSFRRIPDGGAWVANPSTPTYGTCNAACIPPPNITCTGMAVVVPSGGQAPYNYLWDDQQATANDTVTGLCAGTYNVMVTDANSNTATTSVLIDNLELIPNITTSGVSCNGGNDGTATTIVNNGASPYSYLWSNGDTISTINNLTAGNYTVIITDTNDCETDTNVIVPDSPVVPTVDINNPVICSGNTVMLTASPSLPGGTYSWLPGGEQTSSISVQPLVTSGYSLVYTIAGCVAKDTSVVTVKPSPLLSVDASLHTIMADDSVVISAMGGLSYLWNNGYTTNIIVMYPVDDTIYCVTASNNNGCFDTDCVEIEVIGNSTLYIPNTFTPNGDGVNDIFLVPCTNVEKFHIVIFNRWGNLLFETNDINVGWDGKYYGEEVSEGIYVYSIEATGEDKVIYRKLGSVMVLR